MKNLMTSSNIPTSIFASSGDSSAYASSVYDAREQGLTNRHTSDVESKCSGQRVYGRCMERCAELTLPRDLSKNGMLDL